MRPLPVSHDALHHLTQALSGMATHVTRLRHWSSRSVIVAVLMLTRPDQRASYASLLTGLVQETCRAVGELTAASASSLSLVA